MPRSRRPLSFWDGVGVGLVLVWIVVLGLAALASLRVGHLPRSPFGKGLIAMPIFLTGSLVLLRVFLPASRFTILIFGLGTTAVCTAAYWA